MTSRDDFLRRINKAVYSPVHVRKICYEDAIAIALEHTSRNPDWFICGSLALMITGIIKPGDVSDVDFATNRFPSNDQWSKRIKRIKYKVPSDKQHSNYYHCEYSDFVDLFVLRRRISTESRKYRGMKIQNIQDVIEWKKQFNRSKDLDDLMQIYLPESLFEI